MKIFKRFLLVLCYTTSAFWLGKGDIHLSDCFVVGKRQLPTSRLLDRPHQVCFPPPSPGTASIAGALGLTDLGRDDSECARRVRTRNSPPALVECRFLFLALLTLSGLVNRSVLWAEAISGTGPRFLRIRPRRSLLHLAGYRSLSGFVLRT
jgi:hypothetical protein